MFERVQLFTFCATLYCTCAYCVRYEECVDLLLKHGAKVDVEARMCWPGAHSNNCEDRGKYCSANLPQEDACMERDRDRPPKLQSAIYYALDGDQVNILTMLAQRSEDPWVGSYFFVGIFRFFYPFLFS